MKRGKIMGKGKISELSNKRHHKHSSKNAIFNTKEKTKNIISCSNG
jgi:hypothetical protein